MTTPSRLERLRGQTYALYLACRDPQVAWHVRILVALGLALFVPLGLALAVKLIPRAILEEHRAAASRALSERGSRRWVGALVVAAVWLLAAIWLGRVAWRAFVTQR